MAEVGGPGFMLFRTPESRGRVGALVGWRGWEPGKKGTQDRQALRPTFFKGRRDSRGQTDLRWELGSLGTSCPKCQDQRGILQQNVASGAGIGDANNRSERAKSDAFSKTKNQMFRPVFECCKEENASHWNLGEQRAIMSLLRFCSHGNTWRKLLANSLGLSWPLLAGLAVGASDAKRPSLAGGGSVGPPIVPDVELPPFSPAPLRLAGWDVIPLANTTTLPPRSAKIMPRLGICEESLGGMEATLPLAGHTLSSKRKSLLLINRCDAMRS